MTDLTCRELVDFLDDYLDGLQAEEVRARFEQHLNKCPYCRDFLHTYQETVRLGKGALCHPDDPVPPTVPDDLVRAILEASRPRD